MAAVASSSATTTTFATVISSLQSASSLAALKIAVDAIPRDKQFFTAEVRDAILSFNFSGTSATTQGHSAAARSLTIFFLEFARFHSSRVKSAKVRNLIINYLLPHDTAPGSTAEVGELITWVTSGGTTIQNSANAKVFSSEKALTMILSRFERIKTEKDARYIVNAFNNILISNTTAVQTVVNKLKIEESFRTLIPFTTSNSLVVVWFVHALFAFLNNNPEGQRKFSSPEWVEIVNGMLPQARKIQNKSFRERTVGHINKISEILSHESAGATRAKANDDDVSSSSPFADTVCKLMQIRPPSLEMFDTFITKMDLIQDEVSTLAAARFLTFFSGIANGQVRKSTWEKNSAEICDLVENCLIPEAVKSKSTETVETVYRALKTSFEHNFFASEVFVSRSFFEALESSIPFGDEHYFVKVVHLLLQEKYRAKVIPLLQSIPSFSSSFISKFESCQQQTTEIKYILKLLKEIQPNNNNSKTQQEGAHSSRVPPPSANADDDGDDAVEPTQSNFHNNNQPISSSSASPSSQINTISVDSLKAFLTIESSNINSTIAAMNKAVADSTSLIQKHHPTIIKKLEDDLDAEKATHKKTLDQLSQRTKRVVDLEKEKSSLQSKLTASTNENAKLRQTAEIEGKKKEEQILNLNQQWQAKMNVAQREQQVLKSQLATLQSKIEEEARRFTRQQTELSRVQKELENEKRQHSQTSADLERTKRDLQNYQVHYSSASAEARKYKDLSNGKDATIKSLQSLKTQNERELQQSKVDLQRANGESDALRVEVTSLKQQNTTLQAEKTKAEKQLDSAEIKLVTLQSQLQFISPFVKDKPYLIDFSVNGLPPAVDGVDPTLKEVDKTSRIFAEALSLMEKSGRLAVDPTPSVFQLSQARSSPHKLGPVAGFTLEKLDVIIQRHPHGFEDRIKKLQNVQIPSVNNTSFSHEPWRNKIREILRAQFLPRASSATSAAAIAYSPFSTRTQTPTPPDLINVFHGTSADRVQSITNGLVSVRSTDAGFFGSGVYTTTSIEYAAQYARGDFDPTSHPQNHYYMGSPRSNPRAKNGCFPVVWCVAAVKNCYAVTREDDYRQRRVASHVSVSDWYDTKLKTGYDCHCAVVGSTNQYQAVSTNAASSMEYMELVFDQEAQIHPIAVLWLKQK